MWSSEIKPFAGSPLSWEDEAVSHAICWYLLFRFTETSWVAGGKIKSGLHFVQLTLLRLVRAA